MKANIGTNLKDKKQFTFNLNKLIKHFACFGGSGSGKTVMSKVIIEEAVKQKIPCIVVDPQGDLASLALSDDDIFKANVKIYTPASSKGIPLSINPLKLPEKGIDKEDSISIISSIANSVCGLIGYDLDKDKGKQAQAIIYHALESAYNNQYEMNDFNNLIKILEDPNQEMIDSGFMEEKSLKDIIKKLRFLTIGEKDLLFNSGVNLDIGKLLKNDISVIYLNTLAGKKEKEFFVSTLGLQLYEWMLTHPSKTLQALFFIDEIADYIPAGAIKPASKEILKLIYKQARKYGVGCMVSTQNPGDIDYKAFAQFGTWAIGRLTTKQDREKVKEAMKSMAGNKVDKLVLKMPKLKPGEFLFFCPDEFDDILEIKTRWLYTKHETLTEEQVKELMKFENKTTQIKTKIKDVKNEIKRIKKSPFKYFKINVSRDELTKIIEKKKKKMFIFFGPEKEKLISKEMVLKPIYRTTVRTTKKTLLGKQKIEDFRLFFNAETGNIMQFKKGYYTEYQGIDKLKGLTGRELSAVKLLKDKQMTNAEISQGLGITDSFVNKTMNELMKKKIISYAGKEGRSYIWKNITEIEYDNKISKFQSKNAELDNHEIEGKTENEKISIKEIEFFMRMWFEAEIIEHDKVYYPVYELKFSGKNKQRTQNISAVTGRAI